VDPQHGFRGRFYSGGDYFSPFLKKHSGDLFFTGLGEPPFRVFPTHKFSGGKVNPGGPTGYRERLYKRTLSNNKRAGGFTKTGGDDNYMRSGKGLQETSVGGERKNHARALGRLLWRSPSVLFFFLSCHPPLLPLSRRGAEEDGRKRRTMAQETMKAELREIRHDNNTKTPQRRNKHQQQKDEPNEHITSRTPE